MCFKKRLFRNSKILLTDPRVDPGNVPIYQAMENGHLEVVKLLHNEKVSKNSNLLYFSVRYGSIEINNFLLSKSKLGVFEYQDVLKEAAKHSSLKINKLLLDNYPCSEEVSFLSDLSKQIEIDGLKLISLFALQRGKQDVYYLLNEFIRKLN